MLLKRQIHNAASSPVARIIEAAGQIILGKEAQIRMSLACRRAPRSRCCTRRGPGRSSRAATR